MKLITRERLVGKAENPGQAVSDAHQPASPGDGRGSCGRPLLERVFDKEFLGRKWKHVIEPRADYRFVTGVNNFSNILKFDERDILTDTHEVGYGFVTRLYAKRNSEKPEDCDPIMSALTVGGAAPESTIPWQHTNPVASRPCQAGPQVREIVTWELAQKYFLDPTFGGALIPGQRNVFTTTVDLTGIAFLTRAAASFSPGFAVAGGNQFAHRRGVGPGLRLPEQPRQRKHSAGQLSHRAGDDWRRRRILADSGPGSSPSAALSPRASTVSCGSGIWPPQQARL